MQPDLCLNPQDWMSTPQLKRLLSVFAAQNISVRFVGGCIRDTLAGRLVSDVDLATPATPDKVKQILEQADIKLLLTGFDHGTVTAIIDRKCFEITTLRKDIRTDGRHADVEFTEDWMQDASRRDFTFNALSCEPGGNIFDPFDGKNDLEQGRVKFIGEPKKRIEEDVLRLLRFFRFYAYYGGGFPNQEALAACSELAPLLKTLSGERVRDEVFKILNANNVVKVWELMLQGGIVEHFLPQATKIKMLEKLVSLEHMLGITGPLRRLAALLKAREIDVPDIARHLRLSRNEQNLLSSYVNPPKAINANITNRDLDQLLYRLSPKQIYDFILLNTAASEDSVPNERLRDLLRYVSSWEKPLFPIKGDDILALGIAPGIQVGALLKDVEEWWVARKFEPSREACLSELKWRHHHTSF